MRVAVYGNMLNMGYFMTKLLVGQGVDACYFFDDSPIAQNHPNWFLKDAKDPPWMRRFPALQDYPYQPQPLTSVPDIARLYEEVSRFDVLLYCSDGPAIFSELQGIPRVLWALGFDLQNLPLMVENLYWAELRRQWSVDWQYVFKGHPGRLLLMLRKLLDSRLVVSSRLHLVQQRQRMGLQQCCRFIIYPYQEPYLRRLQLDARRSVYIPALIDTSACSQVEQADVQAIEQEFRDVDMLLVHPTRMLYLKLDDDGFAKDNHKLVEGYAQFLKQTRLRTKLVMIRKGRAQDLEHMQGLVRRLGLEDAVVWKDEMPSRVLRAWYQIDKAVICDQFGTDGIGSIGREASFAGRPLVSAWTDASLPLFRHERPPHLLPAMSSEAVYQALRKLEATWPDRQRLYSEPAKLWFERQQSDRALMPRYIEVLRDALAESKARGSAPLPVGAR